MPRPPTIAQRLDAIGLQPILDRIECGESQSEIAREFKVDVSELNRFLHRDAHSSARARLAMLSSAESWIDRGHNYLLDAPADNAEIQRARALEQHCARRAAIRNPAYRDKVDMAHSVAPGSALGMSDDELLLIARRVPMVERVEEVKPAAGANADAAGANDAGANDAG